MARAQFHEGYVGFFPAEFFDTIRIFEYYASSRYKLNLLYLGTGDISTKLNFLKLD
jgi:hypothetical protein